MSLNKSALIKDMITAAKDVFSEGWPEVKEIAEDEIKGIALAFKTIEKLRLKGKITQRQAKILVKMKRNSAQIMLLAIEGMGAVLVERAINASASVVKDVVNRSLGFKLI